MQAAAVTVRTSRLAIASAIAGVVSLASPYAFPALLLWTLKAPIPGPWLVGSVLPLLPPVVAIACGHAALMATRGGVLRGRRVAWAGLVVGYVGLAQTIAFEGLFWFIVRFSPIGY